MLFASSKRKTNTILPDSSDSRSPVCATATFDLSFYSYRCYTENWSWFIYLSSTRSNAATPVQLITKRITGSSVVDVTSITSSVPRSTSSSSADGPDSATSSTSTAVTTNSLSNGTSGQNGGNVHKKSSLAGPIAGGVCGGIALILAVLFTWFFIAQKKKLKSTTAPSIDPSTTYQNPDTLRKPELEGSAVVSELPDNHISTNRIQ